MIKTKQGQNEKKEKLGTVLQGNVKEFFFF